MRDRYKIIEQDGVHFLTSTVSEWLPVFTSQPYFDIVVETLKFCIDSKAFKLYAYVILDNHFHLIASSPDLSSTMASLRKYTAKRIIEQLEADNKSWLLNQLTFFKKRHKKESQYQVWQEGMHPELIQNAEMLSQKIEYIHKNPVARGYVDEQEHWRYSSARNYVNDDHSIIKVDCSLC
ncbi:transposase [candidate division KSB1 bacterium]|nr:transposase [candidate division KSB1 bacterium]